MDAQVDRATSTLYAKLEERVMARDQVGASQVYYDLVTAREDRKIKDVALVRIEQLYPFPAPEIDTILASYPENVDVMWVQEEPRNMGAWRLVEEKLQPALDCTLRYVGRRESASPAAGSLRRHQQEHAEIMQEAFV